MEILFFFQAAHVTVDADYQDRAKVRRKLVGSEADIPKPRTLGSDGVYDNCAAAPVPGASLDTVELRTKPKKVVKPISEENKGFKLLKSMGWSEGKGLGKMEQGAVHSIATSLKADRQGLGHDAGEAVPKKKPMTQREKVLEKTRSRFEEIDKR
uniref:G-patch domain-containing protein n=1 Tax=Panagrolaimus sp. JU765 TaxID=591449 RepID=A0AC34QWD2_9BILA